MFFVFDVYSVVLLAPLLIVLVLLIDYTDFILSLHLLLNDTVRHGVHRCTETIWSLGIV